MRLSLYDVFLLIRLEQYREAERRVLLVHEPDTCQSRRLTVQITQTHTPGVQYRLICAYGSVNRLDT